MLARGALLVVLAGCGRFGFDATGDGGTTDVTGDADSFGSFGPPVEVTPLTGPFDHDYGPTLGDGGLQIAFTSSRIGGFTIWTASRTVQSEMFGAPAQIPAVDVAGGIENDPELSIDALELLFASGGAPRGIHRLTRTGAGSPWTGPPVAVTGLADRDGASLMLGDLRLLVSRVNGGIEEYARPVSGAAWSLVRTHSLFGQMVSPAVREDGLELFCVEATANQLFRAERASIDEEFGPPGRVLFGNAFDSLSIVDPELTADARTLYLSIDQGANHDIFMTTR